MNDAYLPDRLYHRLFTPWTLPKSEWTLCREDWKRVDAITALPWHGRVLDVGSGDGTLGAMVASRNPRVAHIWCQEPDAAQCDLAQERWADAGWPMTVDQGYPVGSTCDCALCCEVLEHLTPDDGMALLKRIRAALAPAGMLCVTVPKPGGPRADYPGHINVMALATLQAMLREAGFTVGDNWRTICNPAVPHPCGPQDIIWILVVCYA